MASTGVLRGFHLMINAISRDKARACWLTACMTATEHSPESARNRSGNGVNFAAMGKTRSRFNSLSRAECCTPGRKANSRQ